ncbi:MAG: hypothetical protein K0S02_598 [Achromobacter mucicolens]|jgi:hypothetical protein|uniref:NUMOD3 domain-containing DNA-binding protein n=1 Tax=Achromobacter mucicolens TaxID=1389922 RepID=UPI00242F9380|nr:NUMOD3 domain-containing DNA-binding protein [Achromobacter mucicolens]MDF2860326.1 hypothetical protein [Achromobacter mucicolens]
MATAGFCVYEHIRPDTGQVFYVGKGSGDRPFRRTSRNQYWRNIVAKTGFEVRIRFQTDCEELAHFVEEELIAHHRLLGTKLSNLTAGGEGVSGFHRKQSAEEIELRRSALIGKKRTPEQRARIAAAKKGHGLGRKLSDEVRRKIGAAQMGHNRPMEKLKGKARPEHVCMALRAANDARFADRRRRLTEALLADPSASDAAIARATGCNRETVAKYRKTVLVGAI